MFLEHSLFKTLPKKCLFFSDLINSKSSEDLEKSKIFLVFEFVSYDLQRLIKKRIKFEICHIKCFMKQILSGLDFIHNQCRVMHRDLKGMKNHSISMHYRTDKLKFCVVQVQIFWFQLLEE